MSHIRYVRLFRNGRNQAIRIPREFELPGSEAVMRREGDRLVIEPVALGSLADWLRTAIPLPEDIGPIDDRLPEPVIL